MIPGSGATEVSSLHGAIAVITAIGTLPSYTVNGFTADSTVYGANSPGFGKISWAMQAPDVVNMPDGGGAVSQFLDSFLRGNRDDAPRKGERYWPAPDRIEEARARGKAAVAYIAEQGFDVIGDLDSLLVPDTLPERRTPESVTDAEVAAVAVELAARMLHDVRDLRHERRELRHELEAAQWRADHPGLRLALVTRWPWLKRLLLRD